MSKILVTGGAGFIGSNLCESLLSDGHSVVCLDNLSTGHIENIKPLLEQYPNHFQFIKGDIRFLDDCKLAVSGVEYVLHEAALGSVPRSIKDPITSNNANVGNVSFYECKDCIVHIEDAKKVVIQGLEGYIISEKNGQLLICKRSEEQRIKEFNA